MCSGLPCWFLCHSAPFHIFYDAVFPAVVAAAASVDFCQRLPKNESCLNDSGTKRSVMARSGDALHPVTLVRRISRVWNQYSFGCFWFSLGTIYLFRFFSIQPRPSLPLLLHSLHSFISVLAAQAHRASSSLASITRLHRAATWGLLELALLC